MKRRRAALFLAAAACAIGAAPAAAGADAYDVAVDIAEDGPRPATSRAERDAHVRMHELFEDAGLEAEYSRFRVPGKGRSRNVIGTLDGPHKCLRIAMAHADTMPAGPGANDNASGLGALAELATRLPRLMADGRMRCDVMLVATGAEERGYTGSRDHLGAAALTRLVRRRELHRHLRWALSLDEVGRDRPFWIRSPVSGPRKGVESELLHAAKVEGYTVHWVRDDAQGNSDHREFQLSGMRGMKLGVGAGGEPCRHSACDRPSRLRASSLRAAVRIVERALRKP